MNLDQIPIFAMLKGKMGYLAQRQRLIAENVANADTPGYAARDLAPFTLPAGAARGAAGPAAVAPARTSAAHMAGIRPAPSGPYKPVSTPDAEVTLDNNQVGLEEQMMKLTEARLDYDAAIGFYQKSLNLLRLASKPPGRG